MLLTSSNIAAKYQPVPLSLFILVVFFVCIAYNGLLLSIKCLSLAVNSKPEQCLPNLYLNPLRRLKANRRYTAARPQPDSPNLVALQLQLQLQLHQLLSSATVLAPSTSISRKARPQLSSKLSKSTR
jgi:hypothetical protein